MLKIYCTVIDGSGSFMHILCSIWNDGRREDWARFGVYLMKVGTSRQPQISICNSLICVRSRHLHSPIHSTNIYWVLLCEALGIKEQGRDVPFPQRSYNTVKACKLYNNLLFHNINYNGSNNGGCKSHVSSI